MIVIAIFLGLILPANEYQLVGGETVLVEVSKDLSVSTIVQAPIDSLAGNDDGNTIKIGNEGKQAGTISLVLLVLAIGGFVTLCTKLGMFDSLITVIVESRLSISQVTALLTIYFVLSGVSYGLYETAICYIPILTNLYQRFKVKPIFGVKLLILSLAIGYIASPINPFATVIVDNIAGNTANLFGERAILLTLLTVTLIIYLLFDLRTYKLPAYSHETTGGSLNSLDKVNIMLFFVPYIYMSIGFIPNFMFSATMSSVTICFILSSFVLGLVNSLSSNEIIDQLLLGVNYYMVVAVAITLARTVYVILYNAHVLDTIINSIVRVISPFSSLTILFAVTSLFLILGYVITSPSALAMITLPIIVPSLEFVGIPVSITVTIFLLCHGLNKMTSIISPLIISGINSINIDYKQYLKAVIPFISIVFTVTLIVIVILY